MNKTITFIVLIALVIVGFILFQNKNMTNSNQVSVTPISHATGVIQWDETTIYMDPVGGEGAFEGQSSPNIILITDIHGDHLDVNTLNAITSTSTVLIAPQAVVDELPGNLASMTQVLANGESLEVQGLTIHAIPMYNLPESDDAYHVKGRGNGYIIEKNNYRVYIAGDTAGIPEMRSLESIGIAFVPMNLPYTMDVEEAADAVVDFAPQKVYPYHYRGQDGLSDIDRFRELVENENPNIKVILEDWYSNTN